LKVDGPPGSESALRHVYVTFIRTAQARLWRAITTFEVAERYYFGGGMKRDG